jgi:2'-5' RNA ligase
MLPAIYRIINAHLNRSYSYSSVQVNMPENLATEIINWSTKNIPDDILTGDGRENEIHITCKYGLLSHDPYELRDCIRNFGPIEVTLGEISIFENDMDVIKIEVESPKLCKLNKIITNNFDCKKSDFGDFIPHLTLAYVKAGWGKKYVGNKTFSGRKIKFNSVVFSGNDNRKTELPLN